MRITATIPHACSWINACACYRTSCIVNVGVKGHGLKATPLEGSLANDHGELGVSVREVSLSRFASIAANVVRVIDADLRLSQLIG